MVAFERRAAMSRSEKIDKVNGIQSHLRFCFFRKSSRYRNFEVLVEKKNDTVESIPLPVAILDA